MRILFILLGIIMIFGCSNNKTFVRCVSMTGTGNYDCRDQKGNQMEVMYEDDRVDDPEEMD